MEKFYDSAYSILQSMIAEQRITNEKFEELINVIQNNKPRVEKTTLIL